MIVSVAPEGKPIVPFASEGDLWLNTWADDGQLYSGWGDGKGPGATHPHTDSGCARLTGTLPNITGEIRAVAVPQTQGQLRVNNKPSSMLFLDGQLVGAFHSPLGNARLGFLGVSKDDGATWRRLGFFDPKTAPSPGDSPWTLARNSHFRCLSFINMGQAYRLNTDGYVYALAIGPEWAQAPLDVYLCRVPRKNILNYAAYTYFTGLADGKPSWSASQDDAKPLPGVHTEDMGSAMYHPQLGRYLFLTRCQVYDAPAPWGPWTLAGTWNLPELRVTSPDYPLEWQGGYMPGIISKDTGPDSFWFTFAGQKQQPKIDYKLHLGKMNLVLRPGDEARVTQDPVSQRIATGMPVHLSIAATGRAPLAYQWNKDGIVIPSATQPELTFTAPTAADAGNYNCTVTNSLGSATSGTATLSTGQ